MSEVITIIPVPLTQENFAPYGDVLYVDDKTLSSAIAANQGSALRRNYAAQLFNDRPLATPNMALFRSNPRVLPFTLHILERHPHSSQTFVPLKIGRFVVVAAPTLQNGEPDFQNIQCFLAQKGQAINYHRGTWHHPLIVLDEPADLLMLAWEDQSRLDCEECEIPLTVTLNM